MRSSVAPACTVAALRHLHRVHLPRLLGADVIGGELVDAAALIVLEPCQFAQLFLHRVAVLAGAIHAGNQRLATADERLETRCRRRRRQRRPGSHLPRFGPSRQRPARPPPHWRAPCAVALGAASHHLCADGALVEQDRGLPHLQLLFGELLVSATSRCRFAICKASRVCAIEALR